MAYNENIANRIRESLAEVPSVEEKIMFGGVCFMVDGKMCMGVVKDEMMCRIDPARELEVFELPGCRPMDFTGRPMKGYVYVDEQGMKSNTQMKFWTDLCLEFNKLVKPTKRKKSKP